MGLPAAKAPRLLPDWARMPLAFSGGSHRGLCCSTVNVAAGFLPDLSSAQRGLLWTRTRLCLYPQGLSAGLETAQGPCTSPSDPCGQSEALGHQSLQTCPPVFYFFPSSPPSRATLSISYVHIHQVFSLTHPWLNLAKASDQATLAHRLPQHL